MLHKEFNNGLRAYPIHQVVQAMGSTAVLGITITTFTLLDALDALQVIAIIPGMKVSVTFDQLSIKDLSISTEHHMKRILNQIDLCIKHVKPTYVHCLGGIGRTGTVVGCYLVRHGFATGKNVLDMIRDLRRDTEDSGRQSPETREQLKMLVGWRSRSLN